MIRFACIVALLALVVAANAQASSYYNCTSEIFCDGDLLSTVQMGRIFDDSKTFVDMKLKQSPAITLENFRRWRLIHTNPNVEDIRAFVNDNFDPEGSEFEDYSPSDHVQTPALIATISDPQYAQFAQELHDLWLDLGRKMSDDVRDNPELYSIVYVPNPVIVPGGRFREFYYWDSYWIIQGLLHSEMFATTKGMLSNYISIVDRFGFIANGGRIYYMGRSQPPLLIPMFMEYLQATDDVEFIRDSIQTLEREFEYWMNDARSETVRGHKVWMYADRSSGPRPESYYEDVESARTFFGTEPEKAAFYAELKAAAESGMDFSSRWFIGENGTNVGTMADLKARFIVPVELNAILYWNAELLADFYERIGRNPAKVIEYRRKAVEIYAAVQEVFWHEDVGAWLDWDLMNEQRRDFFVPSNLAPLWTHCFDRNDRERVSARVVEYIRRSGVDRYPGGVPNTLFASGEQWDFPNVWAPMQHLMIVGLSHLETDEANEIAFRWASRWVFTNFVAYNRTNAMFEKYSAVEVGLGGTGGEYDVQIGFGWSNGAVLDLLAKYGDQLSSQH